MFHYQRPLLGCLFVAAAAVVSWSPLASALDLAEGRYVTTTDVTTEASLSLDCRDMKEATSVADKKKFFQNGQNAQYTENGKTKYLSLSSLSLNARSKMAQDPIFNLYRHAFQRIGVEKEHQLDGRFDDLPVDQYANALVLDLVELNLENIETEAALVMGVWMEVVHQLLEAVRNCRDAFGNTNTNDADSGLHALDVAATYYIGLEQDKGSNERGHMLYNLAEKAGEHFGQDSGETRVNKNIVDAMNFIKTEIIQNNNMCQTNENAFLSVRENVYYIIEQMTIPLVQHLIHHMQRLNVKGAPNFVDLYLLSFLPRVAVCNEQLYNSLLEELVLTPLDSAKQLDALALVQQALPCLGVTCEDVGSYNKNVVKMCSDDAINNIQPLAGYQPATNVNQISWIDRDLLCIKVFLEQEAFSAAKDFYMYGYSSMRGAQYVSFHDIATAVATSPEEVFVAFRAYFPSPTDTFADDLIMKALNKETPFASASSEQIGDIVVRTIQGHVNFLYIIRKLYDASNSCNGGQVEQSKADWDEAAAFLIGSLEGPDVGGTGFGEMFFSLAKDMCTLFGTCTKDGDAKINVAMQTNLAQGLQKLQSGTCSDIATILQEGIFPALQVPIIQAVLNFAVENEKLEKFSDAFSLGAGYAFVLPILPEVNNADPNVANDIRRNMDFDLDSKPVADGAAAVFDSFRSVMVSMGVNCADVGGYLPMQGADICADGFTKSPSLHHQPTQAPQAAAPPTKAPVDITRTTTAPTYAPTFAPVEITDLLHSDFYTFKTDIEKYANIAYDIRDMKATKKLEDAQAIYANGNGHDTEMNLSTMSLNAASTMQDNPIYNYFRYALQGDPIFADDEDDITSEISDSEYADTTVTSAFTYPKDILLATEGAVIFNLWMHVVQKLFDSAEGCKSGDGTTALEAAIAYYIGQEQPKGSGNGHTLYAFAHRAGERFKGSLESDVYANREILKLFNTAKDLADSCAQSPDNFIKMRSIVRDIIKFMTLPLVQILIIELSMVQNVNYVQLYALSFIPQMIGCEPDIYDMLKDKVVDNTYTPDMMDPILDGLKESLDCFHITCDDLGYKEELSGPLGIAIHKVCGEPSVNSIRPIGGYVPGNDVKEYSYLDRDALQMRIFLEQDAISIAKNFYQYGWNSKIGDDFLSLHDVALHRESARPGEEYLEAFSKYYDSDTYAADLVLKVLNKEAPYKTASSGQITELAIGTIEHQIMSQYAVKLMYNALDECSKEKKGTASWDKAAAVLIGSLEGPERGGSEVGESWFALAKEFCVEFDTCAGSEDANVNEKMHDHLSDGQEFLEIGDCNSTRTLFQESILPLIPVPYLQGVLYYATENENLSAGTKSVDLAIGSTLAEAVLPVIDAGDPDSAITVDADMQFTGDNTQIVDDASEIFDAIKMALPGTNVDCQEIGNSDGNNFGPLCVVTKPTTGTELGEGLYVTTTYVKDRANIALDVLEIEEALKTGDVPLAKVIYKDGSHSIMYDKDGKEIGKRSLAAFSTKATEGMVQEPIFNFFRYALRDEIGNFHARRVDYYADTLVNEAFDNNNQKDATLASEAMVALNVWMYVVHELSQTLFNCKAQRIADTDGVHSIDEAVAYWIGDGQQASGEEKGHLLYSLTERAGVNFGHLGKGQSRTNKNLLILFNQAKLELSFPDACTTNPDTYKRLREIVNNMVAQMTIPLIQNLIHYLQQNDRERVKIYAHAFVPQVAGCSPSSFEYLKEKLLQDTYRVTEIEDIVRAIRSTYTCLGLTCNDIGVYYEDSVLACTDPSELTRMGGYTPSTDVSEYSQLDLDILQIKILTQMGALDAVEDMYVYGKHALVNGLNGFEVLSLYQMATTSERTSVPKFELFERYNENDKYADAIIRRAIDPNDLPLASADQRMELAVKSLQVMVVYMTALQFMYEAIDNCEAVATRLTFALEPWDRAAALLIGSLEGTTDGGSDDGLMFYGLAKKACKEFGTCSATGNAKVNERLETLLYTGRGAISARNCPAVEMAVAEIEPLLKIPLIQGTLACAKYNEDLSIFTKDPSLSEGYVFAQSVLPYVDEVDRTAASIISKNMELQFVVEPVSDGAPAVFDAFSEAVAKISGVDCGQIGTTEEGMNVCGAIGSASAGNRQLHTASLVLTGVLAGAILFFLS